MLGRLTGWTDTITALATPPGVGAIAVIRLSGKRAVEIADALFPGKDLSVQPSHTLHVGVLKAGDEILDEVVVSLYRAPRSYTGEDVVEISCHGSPRVQERILEAILGLGARLAKPGEFTQRAFLHGKMDLTQAEAVADLIASHSEVARLSALHTMRGGFAGELRDLRSRLLEFSALMELELDFSQEDVEFADRRKFYALIEEAQRVTGRLIDSFRYGNVIRNGVQVAIVGKPNAGKSTLLNALLNEQRAIVSEIAGTTRDTIEEVLMIGGIEFRLIDTAGIRSHTTDTIESMGIERSREKIGQADIVVQVLDASDETLPGLPGAEDKPVIRLLNKADLHTAGDLSRRVSTLRAALAAEGVADAELIPLSAKTGAGIEELKQRLVQTVLSGHAQTEGTVVTNVRHYDALLQVRSALTDIRNGLDTGLPGDLLSPDIRKGLHFLGEITGEVTNEEQLSWIFGKFCIGK
ncbi:MAG TPA: tRNA uridine-5-carboxymethylaminomethyl(34) synthesis GTPase MnmE [Puia sp.]|nr:tRNA uridine-5-carboxymethylaminomethyl(34) synthesis GTPase MnmE [Puia sp.]